MLKGEYRIALIHDELTRRGGAERVFEELIKLFPQADVYTLYAGKPMIRAGKTLYSVQTSYLQKLPIWFRRHPGRVLPLLPHAAEQFDFSWYHLVISSSSGFAKAIITRSNVPHICYCHAPTRYLWDKTADPATQRAALLRWPLRVMQHYLRLVDYSAAQRVDRFIANSSYTQKGIHTYYRRYSEIVYPPVETNFFTPDSKNKKAPDAPFLLVGRLTASKKFEQAIRVCEKLHLSLVVVGKGHDLHRLKKLAKNYTTFAGDISQEQLRDYYRSARALLQPGLEDFGITSAEALACGTPVIAYGQGGVLDIVKHNETGILYSQPREEALAEAIRIFLHEDKTYAPAALRESVIKFSPQYFAKSIYNQVEKALQSN